MNAALLFGALSATALGSYFLGVTVGNMAASEAYLAVLAEPTGGASATWSADAVARLVVALEATEVDCEGCHQAPAQHIARGRGEPERLVCDECRWVELAAGAAVEEL